MSADEEEFHFEPNPGLPEALPEGERILWSGSPEWKAAALEIFHIRAVAIYAGLLVLWRAVAHLHDGGTLLSLPGHLVVLVSVFACGLAILLILAKATAKTTIYTITNRRVVMRIGVALTMSINLPFKQILSADYRKAPLGTGCIALTMAQSGGLGYVVLWPHVRPFRFSKPQPMLRAIKNAEEVAGILGRALAAAQGGEVSPVIHIKGPKTRTSTAEPVAA
ncbi:MAG: photosynthetic complex putative assembly protein PuhB [Pseudomonadota bacterium]